MSTAAATSASLELHAVMNLVALAQSAQDADRILDGRFADGDRWNRRSSAASFSMYF